MEALRATGTAASVVREHLLARQKVFLGYKCMLQEFHHFNLLRTSPGAGMPCTEANA